MGRWKADKTPDVKYDEDGAPAKMRYGDFTACDYVEGVTLNRWAWNRAESTAGVDVFWVYEIPPVSIEMQCDGCVRQHRPTVHKCTANNAGATTPFTDPDVLYSFDRDPKKNLALPQTVRSVPEGMHAIKQVFIGTVYTQHMHATLNAPSTYSVALPLWSSTSGALRFPGVLSGSAFTKRDRATCRVDGG